MSSHPRMLRPTDCPLPVGLYSHASSVEAGSELVFLAGQLAVDAHGQLVGGSDFVAQMCQVFANLNAVLAAAEMGPRHVAKFTTYLADGKFVEPFYAVREQLFKEWYPSGDYPPNTLLVVTRLVRPEFLIEVEGVAARGRREAGSL